MPVEYVIVRKLEYYREGKSEKHVRDIRMMLEVSDSSIDHAQLDRFIAERDLADEWARRHEELSVKVRFKSQWGHHVSR